MRERIQSIAVVAMIVIGMVLFGLYLQTNPTLCDSLSYPVCTGEP